MPYKRSYKKRATVYRKKRTTYKSRVPRGIGMKKGNMTIFKGCEEYAWATNLTVNNAFVGMCYDMFFSNVPNYANYNNLYDMFRIKKFTVTLTPTATYNSLYQATGAGPILYNAHMHSAIEYGTLVNPAAVTDLQQYQTYKKTQSLRTHKRTIYPKFHLPVCSTSLVNVAMVEASGKAWCNLQQASTIGFNGLRVGVDAIASAALATPFSYQVYIKVWFELKNKN